MTAIETYRRLQHLQLRAPVSAFQRMDHDINYSFGRALTERQLSVDEAGSTPGERFYQKTELAQVNKHLAELFVVNRVKTRGGVWDFVIRFFRSFRP